MGQLIQVVIRALSIVHMIDTLQAHLIVKHSVIILPNGLVVVKVLGWLWIVTGLPRLCVCVTCLFPPGGLQLRGFRLPSPCSSLCGGAEAITASTNNANNKLAQQEIGRIRSHALAIHGDATGGYYYHAPHAEKPLSPHRSLRLIGHPCMHTNPQQCSQSAAGTCYPWQAGALQTGVCRAARTTVAWGAAPQNLLLKPLD